VDGLTGSLLGEHALALVIVSFAALQLAELMRTFPLWQQSLALILLLLLYEFILFWVDGVTGRSAPALWRWLPVLSSVVFWPLLAFGLDTFTGQRANK
jgi:rod shape-determining protein MreD